MCCLCVNAVAPFTFIFIFGDFIFEMEISEEQLKMSNAAVLYILHLIISAQQSTLLPCGQLYIVSQV